MQDSLTSIEVVKKLIEGTATCTGLSVACRVDTTKYPVGIKIPDEVLNDIMIAYGGSNEQWSYVITGFYHRPSTQYEAPGQVFCR